MRDPARRDRIVARVSGALLSQVVAMRLGAIAARLHRTPTPRAVFAVIQKQPQALFVRTFAKLSIAADPPANRRRPQHRGEDQTARVSILRPAIRNHRLRAEESTYAMARRRSSRLTISRSTSSGSQPTRAHERYGKSTSRSAIALAKYLGLLASDACLPTRASVARDVTASLQRRLTI